MLHALLGRNKKKRGNSGSGQRRRHRSSRHIERGEGGRRRRQSGEEDGGRRRRRRRGDEEEGGRYSPSSRRRRQREEDEEEEEGFQDPTQMGPPELESEDPNDYGPGGYHPVQIGDVYADNYIVVGKLGWGHFSTVWLCYDHDHDEFVALKIIRSAEEFAESARDEIKLCAAVQGCQGCIQLFDKFVITGPNGRHVCMVFELAGENLLSLIRKYQSRRKPMPFDLVKQICRDVLTGLYELGQRRLIHTDLKPENILLTRTPQRVISLIEQYARPGRRRRGQGRGERPAINVLKIQNMEFRDSFVVKLADFGNACFVDRHFTADIQTRQYRAPEIILGQGFGAATDMWSFATIVFELVTFDFLFSPNRGDGYSKNADHLAQMIELLGPMDPDLAQTGKHAHRYFDEDGNLLHVDRLKFWDLESVFVDKYQIDPEEARLLADFLEQMLHFDPVQRARPEDLLQHPWLVDEVDQLEAELEERSREYFYRYYRDFY